MNAKRIAIASAVLAAVFSFSFGSPAYAQRDAGAKARGEFGTGFWGPRYRTRSFAPVVTVPQVRRSFSVEPSETRRSFSFEPSESATSTTVEPATPVRVFRGFDRMAPRRPSYLFQKADARRYQR